MEDARAEWEAARARPEAEIRHFALLERFGLLERRAGAPPLFALVYTPKSTEYLLYKIYGRYLAGAADAPDSGAKLKAQMSMLHRYNELKDVAQSVIGRLAALRGVGVADVHRELGLSLTD